MAKGKFTPKSKKRRQRILLGIERAYLKTKERERQKSKQREAANKNGKQGKHIKRSTQTNLERITENIRRAG